MRTFRTAVVIAAAAAAATACTGTSASKASGPPPTGKPRSTIAWKDCGDGFQCGTVQVPLDYQNPSGDKLKLSVIRLPAEGAKAGSLITNPGGPGGSGVGFARDAARSFGQQVRQHFDIVGFDPRGVGASEPAVRCSTGKELDKFFATDTSPDNTAEVNDLVTVSKKWAADCAAKQAKILPYVGTANAAHDIDLLREALGDQQLTFYGASYGTYLGAYYAEEFPTHVRAMVLDGALDPKMSADEVNIEQGKGFDTAARAFAADCVHATGCPLGSKSADDAVARLARFFKQTDTKALKNTSGDGRKINEPLVELGVASALYSKQTWPTLLLALSSAMRQGDGTTLLRLGDLLVERDKNGQYSNQSDSNMAVNCVDKPYSRTLGPWSDEAAKAAKSAPLFGPFVVWGTLPCAYWPARTTQQPKALTAPGAKPIVVVGTTRDPATPYKWAQSLSTELTSGRLLTLDGDGHTAYLQGNPCITAAIDRYLVTTTPPAKDTRCH